jgi:hypothetical protein
LQSTKEFVSDSINIYYRHKSARRFYPRNHSFHRIPIEAAEAVCADKEQDSENEKTTFTFYDGSKMVFSGPEKWVIDPIPNLL